MPWLSSLPRRSRYVYHRFQVLWVRHGCLILAASGEAKGNAMTTAMAKRGRGCARITDTPEMRAIADARFTRAIERIDAAMTTATRTHVWFGTRSIDLVGDWQRDGEIECFDGPFPWVVSATRADGARYIEDGRTPGDAIDRLAVRARVCHDGGPTTDHTGCPL